MYAIIETGSKQYKVEKGDILKVEKLPVKEGKEVKINKVLFIKDKKDIIIGKPYIKNANVVCESLGEEKSKKVISFKYRRRLGNSRRKKGHRQIYTSLKIKDIIN